VGKCGVTSRGESLCGDLRAADTGEASVGVCSGQSGGDTGGLSAWNGVQRVDSCVSIARLDGGNSFAETGVDGCLGERCEVSGLQDSYSQERELSCVSSSNTH